jgi:hypothetical protein
MNTGIARSLNTVRWQEAYGTGTVMLVFGRLTSRETV